MCEFVREYRYLALLRGPAGAGKTVSAKRYRDEQPLMTANGQSPVLYFQLARGEESHKAFYHRVIESITRVKYQKRLSAADLIREAKRLLHRYEYDLIIADEIGNMNNDGLEGARTLYDEVEIPIVFIGMDDDFKDRIETQLPQFYSRIAEVLEFGLLSAAMLKDEVLPLVSTHSHLTFDAQQLDADDIVHSLFVGAGGTETHGARFRDVQELLVRCHHTLHEQLRAREIYITEHPTQRVPKMPRFTAESVRLAVLKSKQRGKQQRPKKVFKNNSQNGSLVRDGDSQATATRDSQETVEHITNSV